MVIKQPVLNGYKFSFFSFREWKVLPLAGLLFQLYTIYFKSSTFLTNQNALYSIPIDIPVSLVFID
jgi:hypothetical protein